MEINDCHVWNGGVCFQLPASRVGNYFSLDAATQKHVSCNCSVTSRKLGCTHNDQAGPPEREGTHDPEAIHRLTTIRMFARVLFSLSYFGRMPAGCKLYPKAFLAGKCSIWSGQSHPLS